MHERKLKPRQRKLFVSGHMSNYHAGKLQQQKKQRFLLVLDQFISHSCH
jgi:hypothetical protein